MLKFNHYPLIMTNIILNRWGCSSCTITFPWWSRLLLNSQMIVTIDCSHETPFAHSCSTATERKINWRNYSRRRHFGTELFLTALLQMSFNDFNERENAIHLVPTQQRHWPVNLKVISLEPPASHCCDHWSTVVQLLVQMHATHVETLAIVTSTERQTSPAMYTASG